MNRYANHITKFLDRLIFWRERHISERYFILLLSFFIGLTMSLMSCLLKWLIHQISHLLHNGIDDKYYLTLLLPAVGILLSGLFVRYVLKDDIGHGVTKVLSSISQRKSRIKSHNTWSSVFASALTIGFGGSVGAESPIVLTGAAIGSNFGRIFRLEQRNLMLLIGCGVAGALGGIFKAPITGLVFVIEVLLLDLTMTSVLPLLISSVTAAAVSYILSGGESLFHYTATDPFRVDHIPMMLFLGIICGLMAYFFSQMIFFLEGKFKAIKRYRRRFFIAATVLGLLIFIFPPLYGEGYEVIDQLVGGQYGRILEGSLFEAYGGSFWVVLIFMLGAVFLKAFASASTNSGGGCGGLFAPTLFVGGFTGFLFSFIVNVLPLKAYLPSKNYVVFGMAGLMAAVMHAPLTGVFLIAELTGGYNLFLPLMLVCITAFATIRIFMPHSLYSLRLAEEGKLLSHHKDTAVLTLMNLEHVLETEFEVVRPDMNLGDLVRVISISPRNSFPVVNDEGVLVGVVELDSIRNIMFRPELYEEKSVRMLMVSASHKIKMNMPMTEIMQIFDKTHAWKLPVIDEAGRYMGFISKSQIFSAYREVLNATFVGD